MRGGGKVAVGVGGTAVALGGGRVRVGVLVAGAQAANRRLSATRMEQAVKLFLECISSPRRITFYDYNRKKVEGF
jgi:hypothetical protein